MLFVPVVVVGQKSRRETLRICCRLAIGGSHHFHNQYEEMLGIDKIKTRPACLVVAIVIIYIYIRALVSFLRPDQVVAAGQFLI